MNNPKKLWVLAAAFASLLASESLAQQPADPVQWTLSSDVSKAAPGAIVPLRLTATLLPGWHLYSLSPAADIIPTTVVFADSAALESATVYQPKPDKKVDPVLGHEIETYTGEAVLLVQAQLKKDAPAGQVELTA